MSSGTNKTTRFKTVAPVMIYLSPDDKTKLSAFAKSQKVTASQIAREGIHMRMEGSTNPYNQGFNDGLNEAMKIVKANKGAEMRFPSGKSFAQLVCEDIEQFIRGKP
jgi:hypothetical protein